MKDQSVETLSGIRIKICDLKRPEITRKKHICFQEAKHNRKVRGGGEFQGIFSA